MTINIKNRTSDWLLGHKVRLPEQKDSLFKMLKLIVKCLSCLRLKTLKTTPRSYRIYSINRPGRLLNFWTLRVGLI